MGKGEGAAPPPQAAKAGGACFAPAEPERAAPDEAMVRQRPAKEEKKKPLPREKSGQGNKAENYSSSLRTAMKASWGTSTLPSWRMRFLPSFCFSRSFFLRVISPP